MSKRRNTKMIENMLIKVKTHLWDSAKEALKKNLTAPNTYIRKEESPQNQWLHLSVLKMRKRRK